MNAELYRRAREVFVRAIELGADERAAFVDAECGNDRDLRSEVGSLLSAHASAGGFDSVARTARPPRDAPPLEVLRFPERIGGYRILGVLGEGGMGVVYQAEQENPRRTVALKVLHSGIGSPARIKRFEHEAQILGRLHHPGIAQVYEAGTADTGSGPQPFLAMELVEGKALGEHAAAESLGVRERLELLVQVCRAAHHAHERGVIHRDLKPANILVDEHGTPKILDFGIARASADDLKTRTLVTGVGEVLGTLPYMSPEQLGGDPEAIDARADVYALGVVGYELLSGRLPISVSGRSLPEAARAIREDEPVLLGVHVRSLRGDVETIFGKALEKERGRRYGSALELAQDLERCLLEQPIGARPPSTMYQLAKFARRNRVLVSGVAVVLVTLSLGIVGTASQAARVGRERDAVVLSERRAVIATQAAQANEQIAIQKANDVLSLSAIQELKELVQRADLLWPAIPDKVQACDDWLADAKVLVDGRAANPLRGLERHPSLMDHEARLVEIRQRAKALTPEQVEADRRASPSFAEWERSRAKLTWMRRMLGDERWPDESQVEGEIAKESLPADAKGLNDMARSLDDPDPTKAVYGSEIKALVLARRAVAASQDSERAEKRDTLARALFKTARFDEALAEEKRAASEVEDSKKKEYEGYVAELEHAISGWRADGARSKQIEEPSKLSVGVAALERSVDARRTYEFEKAQDRWWYAQLSQLVVDLKAFTDEKTGLFSEGTSEQHGWGIGKRRKEAATIEERTVNSAEAKRRWDEAIAAIAKSPKYAGLKLTPQLGLLPISADPESGLWEFAHVQSGEPAGRGADGKLHVTEELGLVLVLIPGGTFWMGAQKTDPNGRNYDPQASVNELLVHEVTLSAYFLSKYEMTQGQWARFTGRNPSNYVPSSKFNGYQHDLTHPVEQVTWTQCMEVMSRLGLELPSEAQWDCGCRGGTDTPWWTGAERESLRGKVNLADQTAAKAGAAWSDIKDWPDLEDGWAVHAPVGSLPSNPYGLHEVHGNVWEWCRDGYANNYTAGKQVDPMTPWDGASNRVNRGGSFINAASNARSAIRSGSTPEISGDDLGLRPARAFTP